MKPKKIVFQVGNKKFPGILNETKTASDIYSRLPVRGKVNLWGEEIYFSIDANLPLEDGKETVNIGDIAYWPDGPSICIFLVPLQSAGETR